MRNVVAFANRFFFKKYIFFDIIYNMSTYLELLPDDLYMKIFQQVHRST
eukprot:SAG11_NODE_34832_length_269_cov_76.135294_1_plen_48_part_01